MKYNNIIEGIFIERPNRFIAFCEIENGHQKVIEKVHVKNTGRCRELLIKGTRVYLEESDNPNRKTRYSLISVVKDGHLINMDSQVPNQVVYDAINQGMIIPKVNVLKREITYGDSRYDIYYEIGSKKGFIEVKGVTLETDGVAMFPDAPTARGEKHVLGLIQAIEAGYEAHLVFLVQMDYPKLFKPNTIRDPAFSKALTKAEKQGVHIHVYSSVVTKEGIVIGDVLPFVLD
jgi:sugar fermentation stimulation protein A